MKLRELKGIGEKTEKLFQGMGIYTIADLLSHFPSGYIAYTEPQPIAGLSEGEDAAVLCVLEKDASIISVKGRSMVSARARDGSGRLALSWFNAPYLRANLKAGRKLVLYGRAHSYGRGFSMVQPKIFSPEEYEKRKGRLFPVYAQTKGLGNAAIQKAVRQALESIERERDKAFRGIDNNGLKRLFSDFVPESIRYNRGLCSIAEAIRGVHFPESGEQLASARERLSYNELFLFSAALYRRRLDNKEQGSKLCVKKSELTDRLIESLPYRLTEGQRRALEDIRGDLASGYVMNRMLQGDVGSGKTVIAFAAMLDTAMSGFQAALMAPTELLARQHYQNMCKLLGEHGIDIEVQLLTGGMKEREKRDIRERIERGECRLLIGTHALFQESVEFRELALVITDEQHRFGVLQRRDFMEKGRSPHVLVMSATPIPRTLALLLYIDMQVSRITELPSNRLPIKNAVIHEADREKAYRFILDEIKKGRQAYIICPMVEKNDVLELKSVEEELPRLRKLLPGELRLAGLHGRMKPGEKDEVMDSFLRGNIDILISTTVVEVGVDVPNSTIMLIENAERFGLAQLHQLRGRVGRSGHQSYCIFMDAKNSGVSRERLDILAHSNDGFHIAEEDLRLRGPGDIFGFRQSGELLFSLADVYRDKELMEKASQDAAFILSSDPGLSLPEHEALRKRLSEYIEETATL